MITQMVTGGEDRELLLKGALVLEARRKPQPWTRWTTPQAGIPLVSQAFDTWAGLLVTHQILPHIGLSPSAP